MKHIIDTVKSSMRLLLLMALISVQFACDQQQPSAYKIPKETKKPVAMTEQETMQTLPGMEDFNACLLYTSPSPRDRLLSRMPSSA